jgi:hypothetical protein
MLIMTTSLDNDISEVQESVGAIQLNAEEKKKNKKARQKASKKEVSLPSFVFRIQLVLTGSICSR